MTLGSAVLRVLVVVLALAAAMVSLDGIAQDNSCPLARDVTCHEAPYGMPPLCAALTDTDDCRSSQVARGSNQWPLDPAGLIGRSPDWLRLARNEIFARHGRQFTSPDLDRLFRARDWYSPNDADIVLSAVEQENVALLARFEQNPIFPLTDAGWPEPMGGWTASLDVEGETPRPIIGLGQFIRLEPTAKTDRTTLLRTDQDLAYAWSADEVDGVATGLGGLVDVPLTVRTFAVYAIVITPDGQDVVENEPVQRFALHGTDESGQPIFDGVVSVTHDGIVMEADYDYLFYGCCGDEPEWLNARYRLTGLERVPLDPQLFEPPIMDYVMAG
jgi:hypothetical protein